ncbi:unnamed protein product [Rotaria magnacalcarata]|uniref:Potassium channel domain-containing protein n=1 Tax=Rotaria magnacalcarata TaxID=392030 RepID=A0A817AN85_9BILA|nr:unnamed protein product [Rotaria magnacalcarata]CAF2258480.1 unnamed protein product [Rotaria magnacalcarata]CAF3887688.1 unnamed protein product [Rotaria magnacalcarata]CAF3910472.1 unnamed protein product [Rotaria magnacalcarata]
MIATRLTLKRYSKAIFHRSEQATTARPSRCHPRHYRATKIPAHDITFIDNYLDDNFEDVDETTKFKYIDRTTHGSKARPELSTYGRVQAPILSFDDEGDIPIPEKQKKFFSSSYDGQTNDSRSQLTILKPGPGSVSIERTRKDKFRHALRAVSKVAFSQLGLGCLVVGYVILGGLIFDAIESRYELEHLEEKEKNRQHFVDQLYLHAYREFNRVLNQTFELKYALWRGGISRHDEHNNGWQIDVELDLWKRHVDYELLQYFGAEEKNQYGNDQQQQEQNTVQVWTFSSAMLYSATVITTIGYGNITPKTTEGKIATMIYAMLGIPLMFMCLTYTGDLLADVFITGYSKMVNFLCRRLCHRHLRSCLSLQGRQSFEQTENERGETRHVPIVATLGVLALYIAMGAFLFARWENWHVLDGAYFCFITFTTIGFGDLVPGKGTLAESKAGKAAICAIFLLFGMIVMAMSFKLMQDEIISKFRKIAKRFSTIKRHTHDPDSSNLG